VNGLNSLSFNGSSYFSLNPFTRTNGVSYVAWFAVANVTNAASAVYGTIVGTSFTANYYAQNQMYITSGSLMIWYRITFGAGASSTTVTLNPGNVLLGTATNFTTGTYQVFQNGVEGTLQTNGPTGVNDSSTVSLQIGYDGFPGESFIEGTISELLLYTTALTTQQRQQIEAYLSQKWGLRQQIPQSHPGTTGIVYSQQSIPKALSLPYQTAFVPTSISACKIWLDAADSATFTLNGSTVSTWMDKTGNGFNVSQATAGSQPTRGSNEIVFNGSTSLQYSGSVGIFGNSYTSYVIHTTTNNTVYLQGIISIKDSTTGFDFEIGQFYVWNSGGSIYQQFAVSVNSKKILGITSTTSLSLNYSINGEPFTTGGAGYSAVSSGSLLLIGNSQYSGVGFIGTINEYLLFTRTLTATEHNQITGYLAWKWGSQSSLPANHPYKNSSPIGTTNPAGISRPVGLPVRSIACYPTPLPISITGANSSNIVNGYYFYYFTSPTATAIINVPGKNITVFALGGGGGGGYFVGGGGGAGGLQTLTSALNGSYTVTVGNGGAGSTGPFSTGPPGSNGSNTTFVGGAVSITAVGGGGGGTTFNVAGANGGCGGGAPYGSSSYGTGSQGYNGQPAASGGLSGGGGGIGGAGGHGGFNKDGGYGYGGTAISTYLDGNQYGGGGGAGNNNPGNETGGFATSGGGAGALDSVLYGDVPSSYSKSGTANKGAGGGGGGNGSTTLNTGAAGGSGIVILSYVYP
jgi:hypothetical protein